MRPAMRFAFVLGAMVALAAAVAGIVIYANHPGSNFFLIGWDELQHRANGDILVHGGSGSLFGNVLYAEGLTGEAAWGNGAVIALCIYLFGSDLSFMALKWALHVLAALLLYQLVSKYRGERVAVYVTLFFLIYPPLLVYEASFLKDDLVAALVIITAAVIDRRWWVAAVPLLVLMITMRANAVLFPVVFLGYLRRSRLRYFVLLAAVPMTAALVMVSQGYFQLLARIWQLPPLTILFYIAKFLLGPLPTNILDWETEVAWIFPWYLLSFLAILIGFLLPGFYSSIRANWRWIVLLLCVSLAPYLPYVNEADVIGPRQFCVVGWLYFLLFYERLLNYGLSLKLRQPGERGWPAAT
jgi:hypothetical protein